MNLVLSEEQKREIRKAIKRGIYKELHKREILTREQLNKLLEAKQAG